MSNRREFLLTTAAAGMGYWVAGGALAKESRSPNERIAFASIGIDGKGASDSEDAGRAGDMVAICDVDDHKLDTASQHRFKKAKKFNDFRKMFDEMGKSIDAVTVSTPDHFHAVAAAMALKMKKHCFVQKPMTHSIHEARVLGELARANGVATQMGNQGTANGGLRKAAAAVKAGVLGTVKEVHVWTNRPIWPQGGDRPKPAEPPQNLHWDLWLGPAPVRPYHPAYCPWTWRNWWDFGTGLLGDLGCHKLSTVFKALKLGYPTSIEASCTKLSPEIYPLGVIARYEFPARGDMPPLSLTWYDGGLRPPRPKDLEPGRGMSDVIYIGEKATLMGHRLVPEGKMKSYGRPPKTLPRSVGHYKEWVDACRGGPPAGANFVDHGGILTETCMLGNVALRAGEKLNWDGPNFRITNHERANQYLHRQYRDGWTL